MMDRSQKVEDALAAFGRAVRARREQLGISQEELAIRAGLHRTYISGLQRGARNVALQNILKLALALETTAEELMRGLSLNEPSRRSERRARR